MLYTGTFYLSPLSIFFIHKQMMESTWEFFPLQFYQYQKKGTRHIDFCYQFKLFLDIFLVFKRPNARPIRLQLRKRAQLFLLTFATRDKNGWSKCHFSPNLHACWCNFSTFLVSSNHLLSQNSLNTCEQK